MHGGTKTESVCHMTRLYRRLRNFRIHFSASSSLGPWPILIIINLRHIALAWASSRLFIWMTLWETTAVSLSFFLTLPMEPYIQYLLIAIHLFHCWSLSWSCCDLIAQSLILAHNAVILKICKEFQYKNNERNHKYMMIFGH